MKTLAIAGITVREALRERLLHNLVVFAVLLVVSSLTISQLTLGEQYRIIANIAGAAYRRPITADEVVKLGHFYDEGAREGGFEIGVRTALEAVLASPHFIFRFEEMPANAKAGDRYPISDIDLASRLSAARDDPHGNARVRAAQLVARAEAGAEAAPGATGGSRRNSAQLGTRMPACFTANRSIAQKFPPWPTTSTGPGCVSA